MRNRLSLSSIHWEIDVVKTSFQYDMGSYRIESSKGCLHSTEEDVQVEDEGRGEGICADS